MGYEQTSERRTYDYPNKYVNRRKPMYMRWNACEKPNTCFTVRKRLFGRHVGANRRVIPLRAMFRDFLIPAPPSRRILPSDILNSLQSLPERLSHVPFPVRCRFVHGPIVLDVTFRTHDASTKWILDDGTRKKRFGNKTDKIISDYVIIVLWFCPRHNAERPKIRSQAIAVPRPIGHDRLHSLDQYVETIYGSRRL